MGLFRDIAKIFWKSMKSGISELLWDSGNLESSIP